MNEHAVLIVGGGPTGMMLAGELALAGIDVAIIERRVNQELSGARAGGLHARTLEVLDQRGIVERFLAAGQAAQIVGFAWMPLDISDFPTRHAYGLALWQAHIERILAAWVAELGVPVYRGREAVSLEQDAAGVTVALDDGQALRAAYLVGCDGGRSRVRKAVGIDFPGWEPTVSHLIAEVELAEQPAWGLRRESSGIHALSPAESAGLVRVMVTERAIGKGEPTLDELAAALRDVYGSDYGVHSPRWISRFNDGARQAASYRAGRVLLAGDAAHIHYPTGGQGLNIGVQDAVNLGWKLALVVRGVAPESLLDSYERERHPVAAAVLQNTLAQVALLRADARSEALRATVGGLLALDEPRKRIAAMMCGLDVHYDFGAGHPLLGRRMPDLELRTESGPLRLYTLLHAAQPLLLSLGASLGAASAPWAGRVRSVEATYDGPWELPVIGAVSAPEAVLVRPDGHVAWVGDQGGAGLEAALTAWCGPAGSA